MSNNYIDAANDRQAPLEAAKAAFFASGGHVKPAEGFIMEPKPLRRDWIDPETVLKRKGVLFTRAERFRLKKLTEAI